MGEFVSRVVDAHLHLGDCRVFDVDIRESDLLAAIDANMVDTAIVQPFPGATDPVEVHERIAALAVANPGRIYGLVSLNPHTDKAAFKCQASRFVRDYGFVGIKLHTIGHAVNPSSKDGFLVAETAVELAIPLMVHTGTGVPFALPSAVVPLARAFPQLTIVLAHAGWTYFVSDALAVASWYPNVSLETSWLHGGDLRRVYGALGAGRMLFGSDMPVNIPAALTTARTLNLKPEEERAFLGENARGVFGLSSGENR